MASCPKCGASMQAGYVLDHTRNSCIQALWAPGEPRKSFWTGLKLDRRSLLPVQALRCERCGYLESYARSPGA